MSQVDAMRSYWEKRELEKGWQLYREGGHGSEWHLYAGLILWARRDLYHAKAALERGLGEDHDDRIRVMLQMAAGNVYRELGDYHMALAMLREVLVTPDLIPEMEAKAHYNLALTLDNRREYEESILASDMAVTMFRNLGYPESECMALQNKAWTLCRLGRAEEALAALEVAEPLAAKLGGELHWQQRVGKAYVCLAYLAPDEALELTSDIIRAGKADWDVMSHAAWIAGQVFLQQHRIDGADKMASAALAWAVEAKDSRCMNDASELRRLCYRSRKGA